MRVEYNNNFKIKKLNNSNKEKISYNNLTYSQDSVSFSGKYIPQKAKGFLNKLKDALFEFSTKLNEETAKPTQKAEQATTKVIEQAKLQFTRKNVNISMTKSAESDLLNFSTNTKKVQDYRSYCSDGVVHSFYERINDVTAIHIPYGEKTITIQVDGKLTKNEVNNLIRYINLQGFPDERYFLDGTVNYLNNKPIARYTEKNIGLEYDFHDGGSDIYFPAQKWACDTRLFHKQINTKIPSVKCVYTNDDKGKLTTIVSRFIPNSQSRFGADWYSLFIDGIITEKQASELVEHIETSILKKNIVPEKSDLSNILQATIEFLNK